MTSGVTVDAGFSIAGAGFVQEAKSQAGYREQPKKNRPFFVRLRTTSPGSAFLSGLAKQVGHFIFKDGSGSLFVVLHSGKPEQAMNFPNLPRFITMGFPHFGQISSVFSSTFCDSTLSYFSSRCFANGS